MIRVFYLALWICCLSIFGVLLSLAVQIDLLEIVATLIASETLFAVKLSLVASVSAVMIALILGIPTAYILARKDFPGKFIIDTFLDIPLVMTPLVIGMGLLFLLGPDLLGKYLSRFDIDFLFSSSGAIIAQTFIATPLIIRSCRSTFEEIDEKYDWAGYTIGLSNQQVFMRIILPMARNGILSGTILAWTRTLGEFGATLMVAGATRFRTETLPIAIYLNLTSGEIGIAITCAWVLIVSGFILMLTLKWLGYRSKATEF
ncbi:ABC transporter permease [bacterium]|nr:ABC transporter permease [bacterium]